MIIKTFFSLSWCLCMFGLTLMMHLKLSPSSSSLRLKARYLLPALREMICFILPGLFRKQRKRNWSAGQLPTKTAPPAGPKNRHRPELTLSLMDEFMLRRRWGARSSEGTENWRSTWVQVKMEDVERDVIWTRDQTAEWRPFVFCSPYSLFFFVNGEY